MTIDTCKNLLDQFKMLNFLKYLNCKKKELIKQLKCEILLMFVVLYQRFPFFFKWLPSNNIAKKYHINAYEIVFVFSSSSAIPEYLA